MVHLTEHDCPDLLPYLSCHYTSTTTPDRCEYGGTADWAVPRTITTAEAGTKKLDDLEQMTPRSVEASRRWPFQKKGVETLRSAVAQTSV